MKQEVKVQDFFKDEFPVFAVYNLYRMVASYVDGLKPSQRKIIHTVQQNNIQKPIKVSQLASKTSEFTQYLHGEVNLQDVIVHMVQDFTGTNNMNVLYPESSFGNRCFPQAAAARYIFTRKSECFDKVYHKEDTPLLVQQTFEGDIIEPRYFIPILPMILVNGSDGIGSGWSQKILPRNSKDIKKEIDRYINNKPLRQIKPWFKGFKGKVEHIENSTWELRGVLEQKNLTSFEITEIPPKVSLDRFTANLIKLEDSGEIVSFTDYSDPGTNDFRFKIKTKRDFTKTRTTEQIMKKFHLIKRVTENFTCMDEFNKVREFKNELEILRAFVDIRLTYYEHRKSFNIKQTKDLMGRLTSKARFIDSIIKNKLKIKDLTKKEIIEYLKENDYQKYNDSFNYIISLPIYIMTKDEYQKILEEIQRVQTELHRIQNQEINDIWINDIKSLKM